MASNDSLKRVTREQQMDSDIYRRCLWLLPVYAVLWAAISWFTGFYQAVTELSRYVAAAFFGLVAFQWLFSLVQRRLFDAAIGLWRIFFYGPLFLAAVVWSALFTLCFFQEDFAALVLPIAFATAGLTNAAVSHFAPSRWVASSYASVLLLPAVFICFSSESHLSTGVLVVAYWFYALLILQRFHAEYHAGFEQESSFEQQHTELQRQNRTDGLTKVFNRRYFDDAIKEQWQRGAKEGSWLALLFIDIDHFKRINDNYGHMAGDECLKQASAILNGAVQSGSDIVARYGGEEFAILLPNTAPDMAERIAESIRKQFELKEFCFDDTCIKVTASIGVSSVVPNLANEPSTLIDQADQGVYMAKEAGRNNVQLFGAKA